MTSSKSFNLLSGSFDRWIKCETMNIKTICFNFFICIIKRTCFIELCNSNSPIIGRELLYYIMYLKMTRVYKMFVIHRKSSILQKNQYKFPEMAV